MHKLNRFKSALIGGAVALTSLAAPFTSMVAPSLSATAADSDNYAKLLQYSLYFYDANMCGDNSDCAISWRGNCHMNDDVPGGFHDAGDHVMFGQPQGYAASTLGWSYYEFKDAYEATGQGAHLKVITDKFAKFFREATKLNGNTVSQVLIEKGEGDIDHSYWGAPENQNGRGRMLWVSGGAANVTAEYAAALAANYVNFGNTEDLKYAKALYEFSKKDTGYYSAGTFYDAHWTGSSDEMAWAAGWLYLATKDQGYLNDLKNCPTAYSVHSWESVQLGAAILKGEITGDWGSAAELGKFQGNNYYFANEWGSARHNATAQLCSLVAAKYNKADSSWAKGQMEYLTGDKAFANGQTHCLVVGFKSNSSKNPHHRAASPNADASKQNDGTPNANLLVGALCGGPLDANGTYQDIRSDYQGNEVAVDYNAGFVGAAAGLYHFYKTGSIEKSIPGVTKIYSGSSTPGPSTPTVTTTQYNPGTPTVTTTQYNPGTPSTNDDDIVLTGSSLNAKKEESQTDGAINNVAEFKPQGAKSVTMYLKVNSNDTEVSGGFGTWTGEWEQEEFSGVKVGADKTVAIDYKVPSNVGATIKAMVWWPHDDDVTIEKIVLHKSGSSTPSVQTTTTKTNPPVVTTTTKYNPSTPSTNGKDIVLEGSSLNAKKEESQTDGAINNVAEFKPQGAKSVTMYLKVNSNDTEVSGGFGTWTGEWEQEEFSGVKVGADKTVAIDYKVPSNVGATIKAMVWWPHDDDVTIEKIVLHMDGSSTPTVEKTTTTTKRVTTTTQRVTTTTTTAPVVTQPYVVTDPPLDPTILGDANNDGTIDLSDAVIIMQALANPNKYGVEGTDRHHISAQGWTNADVHKRGNGVTSNDALAIQKYLLGLVMLPTDNV